MPTTMITIVPAKPMPIEILPPSAVRTKRSRPNSSVPKKWWMFGFWYARLKSTAFGS